MLSFGIDGRCQVTPVGDVECVLSDHLATLAPDEARYAIGSRHRDRLVVASGVRHGVLDVVTAAGNVLSMTAQQDCSATPLAAGWLVRFNLDDEVLVVDAFEVVRRARLHASLPSAALLSAIVERSRRSRLR
jgi:hypothetical protein